MHTSPASTVRQTHCQRSEPPPLQPLRRVSAKLDAQERNRC